MHVLKSENLPFLWSLVVSFLLCEAFVLGVFLKTDFAAFCCLTSNVTTSTSVCLRFLRALFLEVVCFFFRVAFVLILFLAFCFGFCFPAFCRLALTWMFTFSAWHVLFETGSALEHRQLIVQNIDLEIPVEFQIFVVSNHFTT